MAHSTPAPRQVTHGVPPDAIPAVRVVAVGGVIAAILALSVSGQTYLSMLHHGHSFLRILVWQSSGWSFWALAAPFVLRRGATLAAQPRPRWRDALTVLLFAVILTAVDSSIAAALTVWVQPFIPVVTYDFTHAFFGQLPSRFAIDLLVFVLLLVGGAAVAAHQRARRLELRESRLEAELARAQLHALRLEIEPHFLFNTLNSIAALIRLKDSGRALDMLVELGEFMRTTLDRPRDQLVTLATEIDWVRRYVNLQRTRFADRLEVDYQVGDDCLNVAVPTLLLQPLVENALRHGAARQTERCRVSIGASLDRQRLRVWVTDDGAGLRPDFDLGRDAGTGLRNTRSRLDQLYGTGATLDIRRGERSGTTVEIALPLTPVPWEAMATA